MTDVEQIELRVWAIGSTDAADQANQLARKGGYRIRTIAAIRPVGRVPLPNDRAEWIVTLAVSRPTSAMSEAELIAAYGGLPGGSPIDA